MRSATVPWGRHGGRALEMRGALLPSTLVGSDPGHTLENNEPSPGVDPGDRVRTPVELPGHRDRP